MKRKREKDNKQDEFDVIINKWIEPFEKDRVSILIDLALIGDKVRNNMQRKENVKFKENHDKKNNHLEDIFSIVFTYLEPRDFINLSNCCQIFHNLSYSKHVLNKSTVKIPIIVEIEKKNNANRYLTLMISKIHKIEPIQKLCKRHKYELSVVKGYFGSKYKLLVDEIYNIPWILGTTQSGRQYVQRNLGYLENVSDAFLEHKYIPEKHKKILELCIKQPQMWLVYLKAYDLYFNRSNKTD
jgi:hypothetical protein